ncbi:MAG: hypothetical protein JWQ38_1622 [Flavipsychrobacter sp.]|nr:hypothetical protein [Flavipsychrobacter sp.]
MYILSFINVPTVLYSKGILTFATNKEIHDRQAGINDETG